MYKGYVFENQDSIDPKLVIFITNNFDKKSEVQKPVEEFYEICGANRI